MCPRRLRYRTLPRRSPRFSSPAGGRELCANLSANLSESETRSAGFPFARTNKRASSLRNNRARARAADNRGDKFNSRGGIARWNIAIGSAARGPAVLSA